MIFKNVQAHIFVLKTGEGCYTVANPQAEEALRQEIKLALEGRTREKRQIATNVHVWPSTLVHDLANDIMYPTLVGTTKPPGFTLAEHPIFTQSADVPSKTRTMEGKERGISEMSRGSTGRCLCMYVRKEGGEGERSWKPDLLKGPEGF